MPGIAGFSNNVPNAEGADMLECMMVCMNHEPSYATQVLKADSSFQAGCVSRLSAQRSVWNDRGDIGMFLFGDLPTDQDALRLLLLLYEKEGLGVLERLNGWFSGLLFDSRKQETTLFNDRFGLGRIYFHQNAKGFFFASEAKSLLKVLPELRELDQQGFGEFFTCGCALQNRTLFSGIYLLPGASCWTFKPGQQVRKERYFNPETWEKQESLSPAEYYDKLKTTLNCVIPKYFENSHAIALSLTGGFDSRMILAGLRPAPETLPCYTFGGIYRDCEDVTVSRHVAKVCQQFHQTIPLGKQFFSQFPTLAERSVYVTDGAMDVSGATGIFVNRAARNIAAVRMTGNYGGEILRGHVVLKAGSVFEPMFAPEFLPRLHQSRRTFQIESNQLRTSFIAFKQVPWLHYGRMALENSVLPIRSPYLDNDIVALAYQAPAEASVNKELALRFIAEQDSRLGAIPTDRGNAKRPQLIPGKMWDWWKEFLPRAEYVFDYGMPQWVAKVDRALSPLHLEKLFLGRQKYYHFRTWYRDELSQYVKDVLLDPQTLSRPYLDGRKVKQMVSAHVRGTGNYTLEIHKLMTSEIIQRQLFEHS